MNWLHTGCLFLEIFVGIFVANCFSRRGGCIKKKKKEKRGKRARNYIIEKQTQGNHRAVGMHTRPTRMHSENKSGQHSAA